MRGELIVKDVSVVLTVSYGYSIVCIYGYMCVNVCVWVYVGHMCLGSAPACLAAAVTVTFKQFSALACVCVL